MSRSLLAGTVYFLIVFAAAFVLGILRVVFVAPAVGEVWATLLELPFTLAISWIVAGWIIRFMGASSLSLAIGIGASAFVLLMGAEAAGAALMFGRSLDDHVASYATVAGAWGLAGQAAFGVFPVIQYLRNAPR